MNAIKEITHGKTLEEVLNEITFQLDKNGENIGGTIVSEMYALALSLCEDGYDFNRFKRHQALAKKGLSKFYKDACTVDFVSMEFDNLKDLAGVLKELSGDGLKNTFDIDHTKLGGKAEIKTPYKFYIDNQFNGGPKMRICLEYKEIKFWLQLPKIPLRYVGSCEITYSRDTVAIYYPHSSANQVERLRKKKGKDFGFSNTASWYGGGKTLIEPFYANEIYQEIINETLYDD